MTTPWSLSVLPTGVENVIPLDYGVAVTVAEARTAAVEALLDAAHSDTVPLEYRLSVGGNRIIVVTGLDDEGDVDLANLPEALARVALR